VARSRSNDDYCALLIVDIDKLKDCNDSYGHLAGDSVIVAITRTIRDEVRGCGRDVIGRFGGDEFLVFIDNLPSESAGADIAERIRCSVETLQVTVGAIGGPVTITDVTVSIGVASVSGARADRNLTGLLWNADRALYEAKRVGRNAVRAAWELSDHRARS
jgi:diguanylate cyclase (GGDEF)-like protein